MNSNDRNDDALAILRKTVGKTSLDDILSEEDKANEVVFLLLDLSGSMEFNIMRNGLRRLDGLRETVDRVQKDVPVRMIGFSGNDAYFLSGVPSRAEGNTPLLRAMELAKASGAVRVVVVSDGVPAEPDKCLQFAKDEGVQCDVVFVGDPTDYGRPFMRRLAEASGGTEFQGDLSQPKELARGIAGLLGSGN